jgi:hypothetical protein
MKRISPLAAVPVFAAGFLAAVPQSANAAIDQVCADTVVLTWDPPLTNTPQTTNFTAAGQLVNCSNTTYSSGSYNDSGTISGATCTSLLAPGSGTRNLMWINRESSVFSYNWTATRVNGNIAVQFIGSILPGGVFGTANAKEVVVVPAPDLIACSSTGVSSLFGAGTLEIGG